MMSLTRIFTQCSRLSTLRFFGSLLHGDIPWLSTCLKKVRNGGGNFNLTPNHIFFFQCNWDKYSPISEMIVPDNPSVINDGEKWPFSQWRSESVRGIKQVLRSHLFWKDYYNQCPAKSVWIPAFFPIFMIVARFLYQPSVVTTLYVVELFQEFQGWPLILVPQGNFQSA